MTLDAGGNMNRKFLELLMNFQKKAESRIDSLEERLKSTQSVCAECGRTSDGVLTAQLSEAKTTEAYLFATLDAYWAAHGAE